MRRSVAASAVYKVDFGTPPLASQDAAPPTRTLQVAKDLALAHKVDALIRCGELRDFKDAASVLELSRARVSQIMNLLLLAPEIQEGVLELPEVCTKSEPVTERRLRPIVAEPDWKKQISKWRQEYE